MGTQQALTTNQVEVLLVLRAIEQYIAEESVLSKFDEIFNSISWDSVGIDDNELEEIIETLNYYGYTNTNNELTIDGTQYALLTIDELAKRKKRRLFNFCLTLNFNVSLAGIDFKKLEFNIDVLSNIKKCKDVLEKVTGWVQKAVNYKKLYNNK